MNGGWRVVCTWVEQVDGGRVRAYAHQSDHATARDGWAAFHAERLRAHPGTALQIDLHDLGSRYLAESWSGGAATRTDSPLVEREAIAELAKLLRKQRRGLAERAAEQGFEEEEEDQ